MADTARVVEIFQAPGEKLKTAKPNEMCELTDRTSQIRDWNP